MVDSLVIEEEGLVVRLVIIGESVEVSLDSLLHPLHVDIFVKDLLLLH